MLKVYKKGYSSMRNATGAKSFAEALEEITKVLNKSKTKFKILYTENELQYDINYPGNGYGFPYEVHTGGIAVVLVEFED